MKVEIVTFKQINEPLRTPYNPPTFASPFTEAAFATEYWARHTAIKEAISRLGEFNEFGEGDFFMNENHVPSRQISVEIHSEILLNPLLIRRIHEAVSLFNKDYLIYIDSDIGDLRPFYVLVNKEGAKGYSKNSKLLSRLGFAP